MRILFCITLLAASLALSAGELLVDKEASWIKASATATGHQFEAHPSKYDLSVTLENKKLTAVRFSCNVMDLTTDKKKRDKEMFHWLEASHFPSFSFTMTGWNDRDGAAVMVGDLKLHNKVQRLEIPVTLAESEGRVTIDGTVTLDTRLFSLPIIKKMGFLKVKPEVLVAIHLVGTR